MNARRGLSQILFGFLPQQTVDLSGRVWRVNRWVLARHLDIDRATLQGELLRAIKPWTSEGRDSGLAEDLHRGMPLHALEVNEYRGVEVEQFPKVFRCRSCSRLERDDARRCVCGERRWVQWHFVSYHDCGYIGAPKYLRCPEHNQVRAILPGTASARDIRFECPVCTKLLHQGFFPGARCESCDDGGKLRHDVHRASQVYSAKTLTVVNPPDATAAAALSDPTAAARRLEWVLAGMPTDEAVAPTPESVIAGLRAAGLSHAEARAQADRMADEGAFDGAHNLDEKVAQDTRDEAEQAALRLWLSTSGGRLTIADLAGGAGREFQATNERAFAGCGLEAVELLNDFPVLTARYGYTRGASTPGEARLRRYQARDGGIAVYGQLARTEGLLFRLDPVAVARWLAGRDKLRDAPENARAARERILATSRIPHPYDDRDESPGSDVLTLVHSLSHRLVRRIASQAGIDREAIAEYLIPEHLAFVLYAAARGDFVLGGMQALFESGLDHTLVDVAAGERRCPLDPGCRRHGRACVACLHLGEPSCRHFNRYLDRDVLFGPGTGYLTALAASPVDA